MDIYHRVTFNDQDKIEPVLEKWNIDYSIVKESKKEHYLVIVEVYESHPHWEDLKELIFHRENTLDIFETVFDDDELLTYDFCRLIPMFENGYPEPKGTWPTKQQNYKKLCSGVCGRYEQVEPYIFSSEPQMKNNDFMTLIWTYDLFAKPDVIKKWRENSISGFSTIEAINNKTKKPIKNVKQIVVDQVAKPGLTNISNLKSVKCPMCQEVKYYIHRRGVMTMKKDSLDPSLDIQLSYEWFGHGASAFREIIISKKLAKLILDERWLGVRLKGIELVDEDDNFLSKVMKLVKN